ncbi:outer kinetochore KNL1 complex subunit KNL1 [Leptodactylus fuscus]|uniref:outer kinetochore KNL1 complex subunit KNL1 n=1 Tax=Leptodactylus fuscus TaxID=238119 RepID=UPI003F4ECFEB
MDGKSLPQSSDLLDQGHRRRLSSILKAPRSPLKDLGSGNELCQEPTIEKRRKSSRRVSFAETIRVFTPGLQSAASADKENEGFGMGDSKDIDKGTADTCEIAGMDTLLHGPIQAPGHNADWTCADTAKDRTIVFASDNDMDMTTSNTVTILGLTEEKTKKIDTSQFLASLKSQNSEEVAKNKDFPWSVGVEKPSEFKKASSVDNKIKFSDFLASLGNEKSKVTKIDDAEKENVFPFVPTCLQTKDNTGNVTQMFREQDDGLDLTKCHTTNIDSFFPMFNKEVPSQKLPLTECSRLKSSGPVSNDQTVFLEDDMDMTCSHTTRIRQDMSLQDVQPHQTVFPSDKTIVFGDENEMELTRNNSVLLNRNPRETSIPNKERVFFMEHTTILPQGEDMDITKSHTVAIDGLTMDRVKTQVVASGVDFSQRLSSSNNTKSDHNERTIMFSYEQDDMELTKSHTVAIDRKLLQESSKRENKSYFGGLKLQSVSNKTMLFSTDGDDMELTQSHTVCIDQKILNQDNKSKISTGFQQRASRSNHVEKPGTDFCDHTVSESTEPLTGIMKRKSIMNATSRISDDMEMTGVETGGFGKGPPLGVDESNKTVVFRFDQQDMEMTRSHTVSIDSRVLSERLQDTNRTKCPNNEQETGKMTIPAGCLNPVYNVSCTTLQNNIVLFRSDQDDMDITRSHTVAIKNTILPGDSEANKSIPSTIKSSAIDKTVFGDDMELTKSHTMVIDERNLVGSQFQSTSVLDNVTTKPNAMRHEMDTTRKASQTLHNETVHQEGDMEMTNVKAGLLIAAGKSQAWKKGNPLFEPFKDKTIYLCDQDDMDMTKAHTVAIENKAIPQETVHQEGNMEMTKVNAGLLIAAEKMKPWNKENTLPESFKDKTIYLDDQDDMDMTRAHTVAIENKVIAEMGNTNVKSMSKNIATPSSAMVNKSHLGDVKYFSRPQSVHGNDEEQYTSRTQFDLDMDITASNTVFIDHTKTRHEPQLPITKVLPSTSYEHHDNMDRCKGKDLVFHKDNGNHLEKYTPISTESQDKTLCLHEQNDMDITRSHTTAIESKLLEDSQAKRVLTEFQNTTKLANRNAVLDPKSNAVNMAENTTMTGMYTRDDDMDFTTSNTVFIDHIADKDVHDIIDKRKSVSSCLKSSSRNETILQICNMEETKANVHLTEVLAGNITSVYGIDAKDEDMDFTKSNTVFIDHLSDKLHHKGARTSDVLPKRKSVSFRPKSSDETVLQICNMEETKANVHLTETLPDNVTSVYGIDAKDEDMDFTKSNTVFIDHLSDKLHHKGARTSDVLPKRKSVSFRPQSSDETVLQICNMEETKANADLVENLVNKSSFDKTLCNQGDMEMTKSYTVAIESKTLGAVHVTHPSRMSSQVSQTVTSCDQTNAYMSSSSHYIAPRATSNDSMHAESAPQHISSKDVFKERSIVAPRNKDLFLYSNETMFPNEDQSMDITKAHTAAVEVHVLDQNSHVTNLGAIKGEAEVSRKGKDPEKLIEMEQKCHLNKPAEKLETCLRKSCARSLSLSAKSGMFMGGLGNDELTKTHTIPVEGISLSKTGCCDNAEMDFTLGNELDIGVGFTDDKSKDSQHTPFTYSDVGNTDPKFNPIFTGGSSDGMVEQPVDVPDKSVQENGILREKSESLKTTSELRPGIGSDSKDNVLPEEQKAGVFLSVHQKDPEVTLEKEAKPAKLKGKRVSFHFPEKEVVCMDTVAEPSVSKQDQVEHEGRTVHHTNQTCDLSLDLITQASQDAEQREDKPVHKEPEISEFNVCFPEGISSKVEEFGTSSELSEKSKNKRRSIAEIQQKIKSLTLKSKVSTHHTAPVSSLVKQLPGTSQIVQPLDSEQVSINGGFPNTETVQEKEPNNEKSKTLPRENCLPNRLSVKMFQPKLPNKRASSTANVSEAVLSSEAQTPKHQRSKALLKTFNVVDDGQCIDKEMLPACLDDQDINRIFDYEVPEGAWEELCQEEALQENMNISTSQPKDSMNGQKRVRDTEDDFESQSEKKAKWNENFVEKDEQTSMALKGSDKSYKSDHSTHQASRTMEQTYNSSSSQDSRGDGLSMELNSQQYSQMDSQLPWDAGCEQSLWQKFQDGTITVQEFFTLLRIRILIQKPRYSERPSKRGMTEDLTTLEILLDQYVYQPKLAVYEKECHTLYQTIEELKMSTEMQHKPLVQTNSLLWEAMRMCSENELMYFGVTLKNMKSFYSKKSKLLAHEEKVSTYSKLLHTAQTQWEQLQARLNETDALLRELDYCISSLEIETAKLDEECRNENLALNIPGCMQIQADIDQLKSQEQQCIRESLRLEHKKQKVLGQLGCLQEEARVMERRLQEPSFTEWELVKWTDKEAEFIFLYDSLELSITFGECIDGESFNDQPCRRISNMTVESLLDDKVAPPTSILVHRLILQYIKKKGALHETYKTQNDLPQFFQDLSLVVCRCRLLGEELEYLIKWGAKYNIVKAQVQNQEVRLLFSSLAALVKFELTIHFSDTYPTAPLGCTVNNYIGNIGIGRVTEIMSNVPVGLWYLKRTVKSLYTNLLV